MGTSTFSDDFKRDAVAQITERGYPVSEVSARLGVSKHSLYAWKRMDLHRFCSGLLRAILAIKETGYGSNTQR